MIVCQNLHNTFLFYESIHGEKDLKIKLKKSVSISNYLFINQSVFQGLLFA